MNTQILPFELKKIILLHLQNSEVSIHKVIQNILNELLFLAESPSQRASALTAAADYILAYLDLGFSYLDHQVLFDSTLKQTGWNEQQICALHTRNAQIALNKAQLRTIMGRWPASPHNSHSITEVLDDIIYQVTHKCLGTYFYYTAKKDGEYTALYQLTVTPEYNLFFDSFQNRYYQLIEKGNH